MTQTLTTARPSVKPSLLIEDLLKTARTMDPSADVAKIREAYEFAAAAHAGQMRKTGEPYIVHPLNVARTIAGLRLGTTAIIASLLHDVREDTTPQYYEQITTKFGPAVNFLVEGVTRLSKIRKLRSGQGSIEDLRNIFFAMSRDIRVIIIKLADRLHNLETLYGHQLPKQQDVARQTLDVYAPIADRLGMGEMKGRLEDLAFSYLYPEAAEQIKKLSRDEYEERKTYCDKFCHEIEQELSQAGLHALDVHGRAKRLYSLYLKLQRHNNDIQQIYDLVAVRVVLPTLEDCYRALGVIHARWRPLVGKIKDYVATPKANGYQSLHTTVITGEGRFVEVQIRTRAMHEQAERGIAAAWAYADAKRHGANAEVELGPSAQGVDWVKQLAEWQQDVDNPEEFFQTLRTDFFRNRIFCLTPAGEIVNLPEGATPIDFAYVVHTELGHRAMGALVNQQQRPLDYHLTSGDLVEIITRPPGSEPRREWLDFVKTNAARNAIQHWYRKLDDARSLKVGRELLESELRSLVGREIESLRAEEFTEYLRVNEYHSLDDLAVAIGRGERNPRQVVKRMFTEELFGSDLGRRRLPLNVRVEGLTNIEPRRAHCCRPIEGDRIVAVVVNHYALIHRDECRRAREAPSVRRATWQVDPRRSYRVWLHVLTRAYIGMLRDVTGVCADERIPIHDLTVRRKEGEQSDVSILVELRNTDELTALIRKLRSLPEVQSVKRGRDKQLPRATRP